MKTPAHPTRGRPRTSPLDRAGQLRAAKRAQRQRERAAGLAEVPLRLPAAQADRLRVARHAPGFDAAFDRFLDEMVVDIARYPRLRELAWNRADRWIPARDALALYERNWRFIDPRTLKEDEARLIEHLKERLGRGVMNA